MITENEVLTVPEVQKVLRCSRGLAYRLVASQQLPVLRLGRKVVISRRALERMLENAGQHGNGNIKGHNL